MTAGETSEARDRSSTPDRSWLLLHSAALALVLVLGAVFVGSSGLFFVDEGAVVSQVRALDRGTWVVPHPAPEVDPAGRWFPVQKSLIDSDGDGAPYAKHPTYPVLLLLPYTLAGIGGMFAVSIVGTVLAAVVASQLTAEVAGRGQKAAFWLTGLGSPLLFDSYLVVAHTLGASLAGLATWAALRAMRSPGWPLWLAATGSAIAGASLLRSEALLYGAGLALGVLVFADAPTRRRASAAATVGGGVALAYLLDARLSRAVIGDAGVEPFSIRQSSGWLAGRVEGAATTLLLPGFRGEAPVLSTALLALSAAAVALTALAARRAADGEPAPVQAFAVSSVVLGLGAFVVSHDDAVPGLLVAFPLVWWLVPWRRAVWQAGASARVVAIALGVFVVAVLATQYANGGGPQWGGRYFALAIPATVALLAIVGERVASAIDARSVRTLGVCVVLLVGLLSIHSLVTVRTSHRINDQALSAIADAIESRSPGPRPLVLTTDFVPPRLGPDLLERFRWLLVDDAEVDDALRRAASAGYDEVLVLSDGPLEQSQLGQRTRRVAPPTRAYGTSTLEHLCLMCGET